VFFFKKKKKKNKKVETCLNDLLHDLVGQIVASALSHKNSLTNLPRGRKEENLNGSNIITV